MPRLCSAGTAVYCFVWGPDNDTVLYTAGKTLNMKSHQGTGKCGRPLWRRGIGSCGCCGVQVNGGDVERERKKEGLWEGLEDWREGWGRNRESWSQ